MDALKDLQGNRIAQLEDEVRELELEVHLLMVQKLNLQTQNDDLMNKLAGPAMQERCINYEENKNES